MNNVQSLVILQSRFNSSRLPGKAVFPIQGIPLVILAAKRAGNTGRHVVIATSDQVADDEIALLAKENGIDCVRGSLNDTLSRFAKVVDKFPDETLVYRLTADNVIPDGKLLDEMELQYLKSGSEYMACENIGSNAPYGFSAELMRVKHLKEAQKYATSDYDREHVTPYVKRHNSISFFRPSVGFGLRNFRCTIDTFDDYLSVKNIFVGIEDPLTIPSSVLIGKFDKLIYRPHFEAASKPMVLGGVQFGMKYGITNKQGMPEYETISKIIKQAITEGVQFIDTASAYGDSEQAIGKALSGGWAEMVKVITKTPPFIELRDCNNPLVYAYATRESIYRSCMNLSRKKLDVVMLHRTSHLTDVNGAIFKELLNFKSSGVINSLGVSVQTPEELELALDFDDVEFIQLPFNILDYRWESLVSKIKETKEKRNLVIHARSTLLQGLLQSDDKDLWEKAHVDNHSVIRDWLEKHRKLSGKLSISDLCISYANSQDWIDAVVVGVDNLHQLFKNTQSISMALLSSEMIMNIKEERPNVLPQTLNPAEWRK